jgi:uncharacterized protein YeaO (DUF488 family)
VPKERWQRDGYFDVWFPVLAPSEKLVRRRPFFASYKHEVMGRAESRVAVELMAALAFRMPIGIGCFCEDETQCHRTYLRKLIEQAAESNPRLIEIEISSRLTSRVLQIVEVDFHHLAAGGGGEEAEAVQGRALGFLARF